MDRCGILSPTHLGEELTPHWGETLSGQMHGPALDGDGRGGRKSAGHCGPIDIMHGINAVKRGDGEYVVIREDDDTPKNILLRWMP